jgi:DNA-binding MarR family transcriptional regulator
MRASAEQEQVPLSYLFVDRPQDIAETVAIALERLAELFRLQQESSMSSLQQKILAYIQGHPEEGVTLTLLHQRFGLGKATLSQSIKTLEEKGLIDRATDPGDGRVQRLLLTPEGEHAAQDVMGFTQGILAVIRNLERERLQHLSGTLLELLHGLQMSGLISVEGMCFQCSFFKHKDDAYCALLRKPLAETDIPENWYQVEPKRGRRSKLQDLLPQSG